MSNSTLSVDLPGAKRTVGSILDANYSMLIRQVFAYVPARLIPGLLNFLALALYTRWLSAEAYGHYAFVLALVGLVQLVAFWWLRLGLLRFFQSAQRDGRFPVLLSTTTAGFMITCLLVSLAWSIILSFLSVDEALKTALWLGLPLLLVQALFEQVLELNRAALTPGRYGLLAAGRAILSLAIALSFIILFGKGEQGLLLGLILGAAVPLLIDLPRWIPQITPQLVERAMAVDLLRYGMPLTFTYALDFIVSTSDRFLLKYFLGAEAVGLYAAGYDLTNQTLIILFGLVNLAAYPLIMRTLDQDGEESARRLLRQYLVFLVALALPASVGLALIATPLSTVMLGEAFQQVAGQLVPWIALSAFLFGIKAFYFDLAFQLGLRTKLQVWAVMVAALLNITLNLLWIPFYGLMGAAYATAAAYVVALVISVGLGRKVFALPFPASELSRIGLATFIMSVVLWLGPNGYDWIGLSLKVGLSMAVYLIAIWLMDVGHVRQSLNSGLRRFRSTGAGKPT